MAWYMVITRVRKGKKYAGHWENGIRAAKKSAEHFRKMGIKTIITRKPKGKYEF